jgi:hypothetical protein
MASVMTSRLTPEDVDKIYDAVYESDWTKAAAAAEEAMARQDEAHSAMVADIQNKLDKAVELLDQAWKLMPSVDMGVEIRMFVDQMKRKEA